MKKAPERGLLYLYNPTIPTNPVNQSDPSNQIIPVTEFLSFTSPRSEINSRAKDSQPPANALSVSYRSSAYKREIRSPWFSFPLEQLSRHNLVSAQSLTNRRKLDDIVFFVIVPLN
jgi:hypothetical protein